MFKVTPLILVILIYIVIAQIIICIVCIYISAIKFIFHSYIISYLY